MCVCVCVYQRLRYKGRELESNREVNDRETVMSTPAENDKRDGAAIMSPPARRRYVGGLCVCVWRGGGGGMGASSGDLREPQRWLVSQRMICLMSIFLGGADRKKHKGVGM